MGAVLVEGPWTPRTRPEYATMAFMYKKFKKMVIPRRRKKPTVR